MKEKLQEYALIAEIISGISVVIAVVILIISINENTEIIRTSMYADNIDSLSELDFIAMSDPALSDTYNKVITGNLDELEGVEIQRGVYMLTVTFRNYEKAYFIWEAGLYGDTEWERFRNGLCFSYGAIINSKMVKTYDIDNLRALTDEFREYFKEECRG